MVSEKESTGEKGLTEGKAGSAKCREGVRYPKYWKALGGFYILTRIHRVKRRARNQI